MAILYIPVLSYVLMLFPVAIFGLDPFNSYVVIVEAWLIILLIRKLKGAIHGCDNPNN